MITIPDGTGLTSQMYGCQKLISTTSGYIISQCIYAACQFDMDVQGFVSLYEATNSSQYR